MIPQLWKPCKLSWPKQHPPHWWSCMHFLQDLAYTFCEIHRSWLQMEHQERFNWIVLKILAGELMGLITNGDCEYHFAHNKYDIVPTSQESIKVINLLSWTLVLTQNTFQEKKTTNPTSLRCDNYFYDNTITVPWASSCRFSGWRKQQPSGRNSCKVTRHPKHPDRDSKKVHFKQQLEPGPVWLQYFILLENLPHVKLSSSVREMLKSPLWKNYPLNR